MPTMTRSTFLRLVAVAGAAATVASVASAQTTPDPNKSQHMGGGTQPGPGTHGHSSSPKAGETKEIQDKQHNMPATPPHSSGPPKQ